MDPTAKSGKGLSKANRVVVFLIIFATILAIVETESSLYVEFDLIFFSLDTFFTLAFTLEYILRLYAAGEKEEYRGFVGRLKYVFSFWALVDLLAILPMILSFGSYNSFMLRIFRLFRILRLARLGRFSNAFNLLLEAIRSRYYELSVSLMFALFLLIFTSTFLYLFEGPHQPENFGSIPRALWWSIATLTTVGYGDVVPVTTLGKILAGLSVLTGIGMIAMPTGILAAAFSDAIQNSRSNEKM